MLKFLDEIMNYKAEEEATAPTNERLSQFYAFLEKTDYDKFFVWVDFDNGQLRWSFERAPHFYEAGKCRYNGSGRLLAAIKFKSRLLLMRFSLRGLILIKSDQSLIMSFKLIN